MHDTGQRSRGLEETGAPTLHGPQPSAMRKRTNERTNDHSIYLFIFLYSLNENILNRQVLKYCIYSLVFSIFLKIIIPKRQIIEKKLKH